MSRRTPTTSARAALLARPTVVLAWAAAAVLAGSVVWWAVAAIGSEQGSTPTVYTQAQVARLADQPLPGATPTSSGTPGPVASPSGSPTPVQDPTAVPTSPPSPSGSPTPAPIRPTTAPPVTVAPPAPAPAAAAVARTWNVSGGQVAAECRETQIVLLSATPTNGWSLEVKHSGPVEIEVKFRQGEGETSVHAVCADGVPQMATETGHD